METPEPEEAETTQAPEEDTTTTNNKEELSTPTPEAADVGGAPHVPRMKLRRKWPGLPRTHSKGFEFDRKAAAKLVSSKTGPGKDSVFTAIAKRRRLGEKFIAACGKCRRGPNDHQEPFTKPPLCDPSSQFRASKWDLWSPALDTETQDARDAEMEYFEPPPPLPAVFVALGTRFYGPGGQSYVVESIRQWRRWHPLEDSRVYLIVDKTMLKDPQLVHSSVELSFTLINYSEIYTPLSKRYEEVFYIQGYMHPGGDRMRGNKDFNRLVSQRFHAIHGLMAKLKLRHVVHLEGDNMVYGDMREVAKAVASCGHEIATLSAKADGMIPGVVYIKDAAAVEKLITYINDFLSCSKKFGEAVKPGYANDMTYLMNYYEYYGSAAMGQLPSWEHREGESCVADTMHRSYLFDSASFGQWYSFAKKSNSTRPAKHIRNAMAGRFIDATPNSEDTTLRWVVDPLGRRLPMWKNYALLSLHIHAKNLEEFIS